jgi:hypothetical protein
MHNNWSEPRGVQSKFFRLIIFAFIIFTGITSNYHYTLQLHNILCSYISFPQYIDFDACKSYLKCVY